MKNILVVIICFMSVHVKAQNNLPPVPSAKVKSLEEAINIVVTNFHKEINDSNAKVYVMVQMILNQSMIKSYSKDFYFDNTLSKDLHGMDDRVKNYEIRFIYNSNGLNNYVLIQAIKSQVLPSGKHSLRLIPVGNTEYYQLDVCQ